MNTFRFILKNYKQKWLIAIIVPLIFFIYCTYEAGTASYMIKHSSKEQMIEMVKQENANFQTESLEKIDMNTMREIDYYSLFTTFYLLIITIVQAKMAGGIVHDRNYSLLPEKEGSKFIYAIAISYAYTIGMLLISVPIEGLFQLLSSLDILKNDIETGYWLRRIYLHPNRSSSFLAFSSFYIFLRALIRKKFVYRILICLCAIVHWFIPVGLGLGISSEPEVTCIFAFLSPVLLIASWQLYKRWQLANSGFFMI